MRCMSGYNALSDMRRTANLPSMTMHQESKTLGLQTASPDGEVLRLHDETFSLVRTLPPWEG